MNNLAVPVANSTRFELVGCGEPLTRSERALDAPQGGEVLLRMLAAGVCHTDLHLCDGYFDLGKGRRIALADRGIVLPHTLGHENVGEVIALGPDATGATIGDRVLVYPWIGCGTCALCAQGQEHFCAQPRFLGVFRPGGFGEHLMVPHARYLFPIGAMRPELAAPLACSGLTTFSALMKVKDLIAREPVAIFGAGGLGLMCLALLRHRGARGAVVIEPDPAKRAAALALGALEAVAPQPAELERLAALAPGGFGAVLDFVGSSESTRDAAALLRKGGRLIVVGMYGGELSLPVPTLVLRSLAVQGSYVGSLAEMHALMDHVARHGPPLIPVSTRPLAEVNEALQAVRAGQVVGRTVLVAGDCAATSPIQQHCGAAAQTMENPA